MASKGKSRHEMDCGSKCNGVRRLAYEVIKYSALKFGVPENCIDTWKGSDNDYGCLDFCSALFRIVIDRQIRMRYELHVDFTKHYLSNKLETFELILRSFQDFVEGNKKYPMFDAEDIEISLSIACELVLFLYSKKLNLHLQKLVKWFDDYLNLVKKPFEKAAVLKAMYLEGSSPERYLDDSFYNKFISLHCLPYEDSAKHRNLNQFLLILHKNYRKKLNEYFFQAQRETDDIFVRESLGEGGSTEYEIVMLPVTSERNEASGNDIPQNSDIERKKFIEFYRTDKGASCIAKAVFHVFNAASPQDQPQHSTVASARKK